MSQHHRNQKWTSFNSKRRAELTASLPLPCVNCGQPVMRGQQWQVGHILDAALGGQATRANTGPSHTPCNKRAGGKLGAKIVNTRRSERRDTENDLRSWF
jgi:hypothetical protein